LPALPSTALQRSGWIEAISRSRCGKQDFSMYQRGSSSRLLNARPLGGYRNGVTTMMLPDYWLTRPDGHVDAKAHLAFDELLDTTLHLGGCPTIPFTLPWPKWQFLCHLADHHDIALHGSGDANIALFEPRQSQDLNEFGNQKAVYAASDGLWAMFFAVVDRSPGEPARFISCHGDHSSVSHRSHLARTKSISHSLQVLSRFNLWRN
jgi:hypothetical protein